MHYAYLLQNLYLSHAEELQSTTNEHSEQMDTLHTILSLQLKEKY